MMAGSSGPTAIAADPRPLEWATIVGHAPRLRIGSGMLFVGNIALTSVNIGL